MGIKKLLDKDWREEFNHARQEGNRSVDFLVSFTLMLPLGFHALDQSLTEPKVILEDDILRISRRNSLHSLVTLCCVLSCHQKDKSNMQTKFI